MEVLDIETLLAYGNDIDEYIDSSGFEWIYDGRKPGMERYHGNLEPDCV